MDPIGLVSCLNNNIPGEIRVEDDKTTMHVAYKYAIYCGSFFASHCKCSGYYTERDSVSAPRKGFLACYRANCKFLTFTSFEGLPFLKSSVSRKI
jgi:hypothetical protein